MPLPVLLLSAVLAIFAAPAESAGDVPVKPQRIVSLSLDTDEILLELVDRERIAGVSRAAADPSRSHIVEAAAGLDLVDTDDVAAVLARHPDLVLAPIGIPPAMLARLASAAVPVAEIPPADSVDDIRRNVERIAVATGDPAAGARRLAVFDMHAAALRQLGDSKIAALYLDAGGAVAGDRTLAGQLLEYSGLSNAAAAVHDGWHTVSGERLRQLDPALLLRPASAVAPTDAEPAEDGGIAKAGQGPRHVVLSLPIPPSASLHFVDDAWRLRATLVDSGVYRTPRRVVPLTFGATEVLLDLLPHERIAAVHTQCATNTYFCAREVARGLRLVSSQTEDILMADPDLVVVADYSAKEMTDPLLRSGIAVLRLGNNRGFEETLTNIEILGHATDTAPKARALVARMRDEVAAMQARIPPVARRPSAVCLTGVSFVAGSGSTMDDLLRLMGLDNAAAANGLEGVTEVSAEQLLAWDPDVIVIGKDPDTGASLKQRLRSEPIYGPLRDKRIVEVDHGQLSCVSQYQVDAMRAIFEQVYE